MKNLQNCEIEVLMQKQLNENELEEMKKQIKLKKEIDFIESMFEN